MRRRVARHESGQLGQAHLTGPAEYCELKSIRKLLKGSESGNDVITFMFIKAHPGCSGGWIRRGRRDCLQKNSSQLSLILLRCLPSFSWAISITFQLAYLF